MRLSRKVLPPLTLALASVFGPHTGFAAKLEELYSTRSVAQLNQQHGPSVGAFNAEARARRHAELLALDSESSLVPLQSAQTDKVGTHYRYQQLFRGIPVHGADLVISEDLNGYLQVMFGNVAQDLARDLASTVATLTAQQAIAIAKQKALSGLDPNTPTERSRADKMIYIDDKGTPHVIYKTGFFVAHPNKPSGPTFFIDAHTGAILEQWDNLKR